MSFSVGFRVLGLERCLLVCDGFRAPGSGFSGWGEGLREHLGRRGGGVVRVKLRLSGLGSYTGCGVSGSRSGINQTLAANSWGRAWYPRTQIVYTLALR